MRTTTFWIALAATTCVHCASTKTEPSDPPIAKALATDCAGNAIDNPPEFQWTYHATGDYYSGVLEVSEATFDIGGDTLTTRAYRQPGQPHSIPGPTIRVTPGNKYVLRFHNRLPYEPLSEQANVFKDPNASNVHTHGLHISGESPGDDVTRTFQGGFGGDFVWDIPDDHMGGTYWYHAHHHGSTFLQVSGGTFGLLIVDDAKDGLPANVAAMEERLLVLGYLDPGAAGSGGDTLLRGTLSPTWTINGAKSGSLCMPANEWQHWRVLVADRDAKEKTVRFGEGCEVALMARDGVWRRQVPKLLPTREITLTGASRADFAVRCTADSTLSVNSATLGTIVVGPQGATNVHPYAADGVSTWPSNRPAYLRDLSGVPSGDIHSETMRMGARTINGSKFDHHTPTLTLNADKVQAWSVSGATNHPFHLHVYHMQTFGCGGDYEDGEYYDVIASNCDIRFDANAATTTAYDGRTILHCHILEHEDQGAMGWVDMVGGILPPEFPADIADPPFSESYPLDGGNLCGDGTCDASESSCTCPDDCGAPAATELTCDDGIDEDCDGQSDCDDTDCTSDPVCASGGCDGDGVCESGEDCNNCNSDCSGVQSGKPANRYCCGNGIVEGAEGNGSICDDNF